MPAVEDVVVPSRTVHLPLSWNDPQTELAMHNYSGPCRVAIISSAARSRSGTHGPPPSWREAPAAFPHGAYPVKLKDGTLSYRDHLAELARNAPEIKAAKARQQTVFDAERQRWKAEGLDSFVSDDSGPLVDAVGVPPGCQGVPAPKPGNVWIILVEPGDMIEAGETVAVLELMKMEIAVAAPVGGRVKELRTAPGRTLRGGDLLAIIEEG